MRVLDYGCGPALAYDISPAGTNADSEIVLAEYATMNKIWSCKHHNL